VDFPAALIAMVQEQVAKQGRLGATGLVRVVDPAVAIPVFALGAPGAGAAPPLTFMEGGYAIALYGQERAGSTFKFANTEIALKINGERDFITSGEQGAAFFPMLGLFGPSIHWFPLTIRVEKRDFWQLTYQNFDPAAVAQPTVGVAFLSDVKLATMAKQVQEMTARVAAANG
jgi:hypothetical protein